MLAFDSVLKQNTPCSSSPNFHISSALRYRQALWAGLRVHPVWRHLQAERRLNQRHLPSSMERPLVVPLTVLYVLKSDVHSASVCPSTVTSRPVSTAENYNSTIDCQPKHVWNANCLFVCCHSGVVMPIYIRYVNTPGSRTAPVPLQFSHNHGQRR